jgi:hypothetical protein
VFGFDPPDRRAVLGIIVVHVRRSSKAVFIGSMLVIGVLSAARCPAGEPALAVLETHCLRCHAQGKAKGGLDLQTRAGLVRGGESGAAINAADPLGSLLLKTVRHQVEPHMPHKAAKLDDAQIAALERWATEGFAYDRALAAPVAESRGPIADADRLHWAFEPVRPVDPPAIRSAADHPIDRFILAQLESAGLSLNAPADRYALLRRVTFDLIGLPPTPAQIDAFVNDTSPDAYEKVVDRLLASPHYGERWARHWLDLARFAESDGYEFDATRPHAWRYRDYVVESFNADKPYDRFIQEQLAGDERWPESPAALIATGFNLLGPDMVDSSDQVQRRHNTLNDMTDTAALAFMGLTLGCARCHDHKFEPLSQRDYYRFQAFFTPAAFRRDHPIPTPSQRAEYDRAMAAYRADPLLHELEAIEEPARRALRDKKLSKLSAEARQAHLTPPDQRTTEQVNLVLETQRLLNVNDKELAAALAQSQRDRRQALVESLKRRKPAALPMTMALGPDGADAATFVLHRGEYSQPGERVTPGYPAVLPAPAGVTSGPRRAELADWLTRPDHPLTARVMVNRLWTHHFGRGIVATPSDFGTHGSKPSHPQLLDWLARRFVQSGWSVKAMHRLMLTSAVYRQSSRVDADRLRLDPDNRLFSRMNRLRLEGEAIRDALLAVSGKLNTAMGGPGVFPPIPAEALKGSRGWATDDQQANHHRRSIYIFARRNLRFPFLEVFDAPDSNLSCPVRGRSTTAPQSLTLLNATEVMEAAAAVADRLALEHPTGDQRVDAASRLILGRPVRVDEAAMARDFLARAPLSEFCRALFNLNDFLYLQ